MAHSFKVGDVDVLAVSDGTIAMPPGYFRGTTPEQWEPHKRWLDHTGNTAFEMGCFVLRSGGRCVLVDTGSGKVDNPTFHGGGLLADLAAGGVRPEDIDTVFITHLHFDHVGMAARADAEALVPTFPNATYCWTGADQAAFRDVRQSPFVRQDIFAAVASHWQAADGGAALAPGVEVVAMPGHTPGHAGVMVSSGGARAFLLGDAIACPVQLEEPEWSGMGDMDAKLARKTQEALAREVEGTGALIGASHFPGLAFGRVLRGQGKRYWQQV